MAEIQKIPEGAAFSIKLRILKDEDTWANPNVAEYEDLNALDDLQYKIYDTDGNVLTYKLSDDSMSLINDFEAMCLIQKAQYSTLKNGVINYQGYRVSVNTDFTNNIQPMPSLTDILCEKIPSKFK